MPPASRETPRDGLGSTACGGAGGAETGNREEWVPRCRWEALASPPHLVLSACPEIAHHSRGALWRALAALSLFHGSESREVILAVHNRPGESGGVSAYQPLPPTSKGRDKPQNHEITEKEE